MVKRNNGNTIIKKSNILYKQYIAFLDCGDGGTNVTCFYELYIISLIKNSVMTIQYISGFFDADGSITMSKNSKNDIYKTLKIDFTNNEKSILIEIQNFFIIHDITSTISTKKSKKPLHSINYSLSINSNQMCLKLCKLIQPLHSKKRHRINTVLKYHNAVTNRNGKYNVKEHARKKAYERLFFSSIFQ